MNFTKHLVDRFNLLQAIYNTSLAATCIVAWRAGEVPERAGALIMVIGSLATAVVAQIDSLGTSTIHLGVLAIDLAVMAVFLSIALRTDRFWPLWVCGFHLVGVATHLTMLTYPDVVPRAYRILRGFWAYPMLAAIILASLHGHRMRKQSERT